MRQHRFIVVAAAAAMIVLPLQTPAQAAGHPHATTLSTDVVAPFNVGVTPRGIYVADGFANVLGKFHWDGTLTPVVTDAAGTSGVATHGKRLAYTTTVSDPDTFENTAAAVHIMGPGGTVDADTLQYENDNNPDSVNTYGFAHPTQCQSDALGPDAQYTGRIDSHAYSVAAWGNKWLLADAGANDLLSIDNEGNISTVAVLPPQPAVITADFVHSQGLPDCLIGATYGFEPVPTDVEVAPNGILFVTTLPGGPEGDELGARGSLYRVNPWNGHVKRVATGFSGATNVAVGPHGWKYVAELFGGEISVVRHGVVSPYLQLPGVVSVDNGNLKGRLIAGTVDPTFQGPGSIVRINAGLNRGHVMSRVHVG